MHDRILFVSFVDGCFRCRDDPIVGATDNDPRLGGTTFRTSDRRIVRALRDRGLSADDAYRALKAGPVVGKANPTMDER